jgi:hypothetical protein
MTVQNLYTQYLDGKITKQKFLYEVRRDQNLNMISPSNSFDDVVKILKNKSIISEKAHKEAKLATGKQEVDIIAKTIDMVNPYEYTRGMNYELEILDIPASEGDLSEDNVLKAQKKVLANLTKNPQYYCDKIHGKGEVSEDWVEATKKEIDKIGKGKPKTIREGIDEVFEGGFVSRGAILKALEDVGSESEIRQYLTSLEKSGDKFENVDDYVEDFRNYVADKSLNEHGQYADRIADVNADSSPLEERQKAIYEKYCEKTGIPMENLMSMVREAKAKMKEGTTYAGKDAVDDAQKDPKFSSLSGTGKTDAINKLKQGNTVTIG